MRRPDRQEDLRRLLERLRTAVSDIVLRTTLIVGFPGEEEEDFEGTLDLLQRVRFDDLFSFKYSPRKGTRAAQFEDKVEEKIKQERLAILQEMQRGITLQKNQECEDRMEEVLVEGRSKQSAQDVTGRTRSNKIVNFKGDISFVGNLVPVRITKAYAHSLRGELVPPQCRLQNVDCGMKFSKSAI
jgi:tRNA-2-methylthio-N6-dimethylallyladenosine synthase